MDALEESFETGDSTFVWLKVDPRLLTLRSEPRFEYLLRRGDFIQ
jgi:hypothetical protein